MYENKTIFLRKKGQNMPVIKIIALTQFTFYNTVPSGLIKEKFNKLIEQTFKRAVLRARHSHIYIYIR